MKKNIAVTGYSFEDELETALKMIPNGVDDVNKILGLSPNNEKPYTQVEMDEIDAMHSYTAVFEKIRRKFIKKYDFYGENLEIIHDRSFRDLRVFYVKGEKGNKVFCDTFFSDFLHSVYTIIFLWDKYRDDEKLDVIYYKYMMVILYALIVDKAQCDIYTFKNVKSELKQGSAVFNIAVGCQFFSMYFTIAHEIAHGYIESQGLDISSKEEELLADSIAYEIVLDLFIEEKQTVANEDRELMDYCYLAPMMLFDIFDLYYRAYPIFAREKLDKDESHPLPKMRKSNLFNILKNKYHYLTLGEDFDKTKIVYKDFAYTIKRCISEMLTKRLDGSLDSLCKEIAGFPMKKR